MATPKRKAETPNQTQDLISKCAKVDDMHSQDQLFAIPELLCFILHFCDARQEIQVPSSPPPRLFLYTTNQLSLFFKNRTLGRICCVFHRFNNLVMNTPNITDCWRTERCFVCSHGNNWQRTGHSTVEYRTSEELEAVIAEAELEKIIETGSSQVVNILWDDVDDWVVVVTKSAQRRPTSFSISCFSSHLLKTIKYELVPQLTY